MKEALKESKLDDLKESDLSIATRLTDGLSIGSIKQASPRAARSKEMCHLTT